MRFRIGQEVVCIKKGVWVCSISKRPWLDKRSHPKYNDIVTVDGYDPHDITGIYLTGYNFICGNGERQTFDENRFAPILENLDEIKEALNETVEI